MTSTETASRAGEVMATNFPSFVGATRLRPEGRRSCARALASSIFRYVSPLEPSGPSVSPYSVSDARAPVCRASACASFGFSELSGKIARTWSARTSRASRLTWPADGCASEVCAGMTAPTTRIP